MPLDLRKDEPYLVYDQVDFDVPVGEVGDNYDRYLVCVEEMHQSLRIIEQCLAKLEKLGPGPVNVDDPRVRWPAKGRVFNRMEELIQQFKSVTEGPRVPAGEAYPRSSRRTASSASTSSPTAAPCPGRCAAGRRASSTSRRCRSMLRGAMLADLIPTFDFINMIGGECDR